ncbi:Kinesin-like protein kif17 [Dermatophagoides farinae]|uniref:Kinesin-like protein n=1 Tax=Dermatophagoides farinae TaxID=6954 RepID=A0A922L7P0_DERFA|nr:Kinesin-like protein kif17 [Dermatophagoides farinae]
MTSETVKVITRCRPLNQREKELKCQVIVNIDSSCGQCSLINPDDRSAPPKTFTFDGAYYTDSTTEQIYNEIVFPIVESVTEGYNGTVFAYGQTGCGKSFTMQGTSDSAHRGIIPRDLLGTDIKKKLELKEHPETGVYVGNLSMHIVNDVRACEMIMETGWKNRSVGATLMNADSSRSHSIFTIYIERMQTIDLESSDVKFGKLNLVDLAGSERQSKTGAAGDRLKEATKINLSLSALGNVISALVDGKAKHIPFRDSKLTRLLQDSLGGNTKTLMVACISPADNNYDETLSTLRYANRAKNIQNKPRINEDPKDAKLREYQEEILWLKKMLEQQTSSLSSSSSPAGLSDNNSQQLQTQPQNDIVIEEIRQAYDNKMKDLLNKYEEEVKNKEKLKQDIDKLKSRYEHDKSTTNNNTDELNEQKESVLRAMKKLQAIENQMVGGEKANDAELKEKRARKKKIAEAKMNAISEALAQLNDDDKVLLKAYGDITEELRAKSMLMKKAKRRIQQLEQEVEDLQSEFESERTDYLETIRRLQEQMKLLTQILDKVQPLLKSECNYSNLMKIKEDAIWDENIQQWILPNVSFGRIRLPPASQQQQQSMQPPTITTPTSKQSSPDNRREITPSRLYRPDSPNLIFDSDIVDGHSNSTDMNGGYNNEDKLLRKLENSQSDDIVTNYLMPKRRQQLLNTLHKLKLSVPELDDQQQDNELIITTMNNNNMNPHLIINSGNNNGNIIHGLDTKLNYLTSVSNRINERFQTRMTMLSNNNNDNIHQLNPNSNHGIIMNHYPNHYNSHSSSSIMNGHHNHHHQHHNHHQYPFTQSADTAPRKLLPLKRIT